MLTLVSLSLSPAPFLSWDRCGFGSAHSASFLPEPFGLLDGKQQLLAQLLHVPVGGQVQPIEAGFGV